MNWITDEHFFEFMRLIDELVPVLAERALPEPVGSMAKGSWHACCQSGLVNSPCTTYGTHSFSAICIHISVQHPTVDIASLLDSCVCGICNDWANSDSGQRTLAASRLLSHRIGGFCWCTEGTCDGLKYRKYSGSD